MRSHDAGHDSLQHSLRRRRIRYKGSIANAEKIFTRRFGAYPPAAVPRSCFRNRLHRPQYVGPPVFFWQRCSGIIIQMGPLIKIWFELCDPGPVIFRPEKTGREGLSERHSGRKPLYKGLRPR